MKGFLCAIQIVYRGQLKRIGERYEVLHLKIGEGDTQGCAVFEYTSAVPTGSCVYDIYHDIVRVLSLDITTVKSISWQKLKPFRSEQ